MLRRIFRVWWLILGLWTPFAGASDPRPATETGRFYMQVHAASEYGGHGQNWAFAQDDRGLLYVGNGDGVLEYDGVSWHLIETPRSTAVRSLAHDGEGTVFVGAIGDLGYLVPGATGETEFRSLLEHVPEDGIPVTDVWRTVARPEGIYFQTKTHIFLWDGERMDSWRGEDPFHFLQLVEDRLLVDVLETGLWQLGEDGLTQAPGGAGFAGTFLYGLVPHAEGFLALAKGRGLIYCPWDTPPDGICDPVAPQITERLNALRAYNMERLPSGNLAIGTLDGGVVLLSETGHWVDQVDDGAQLPDNSVLSTFVDTQGGLWLGLANGLARLETTSPLSHFGPDLGLTATVNDVVRHQGRLYAATDRAMFAMQSSAGVPRFAPVSDIRGQCWSLISTPQGLLVSCNSGVFEVESSERVWAYQGQVFAMHQLRQDPSQILLGLDAGLARLVLEDGAWKPAGRVDGIDDRIRSFSEDETGRLWIASQYGAEVLLFGDPAHDLGEIQVFGVDHGLPDAELALHELAGGVMISAADDVGLYEVDSFERPQRFVPSKKLESLLSPSQRRDTVYVEDQAGQVWALLDGKSGRVRVDSEGSWSLVPSALNRIVNLRPYVVYQEDGGLVWIGSPDGLIRYATQLEEEEPESYRAWIRYITKPDGVLLDVSRSDDSVPAPSLPFRDNAVRFAFAAPRFDAPDRTRYRTRLEGFDDDWSDWSTEPYKDYTNLWEGRYTFRVQAQDVYGATSAEDSFAFHVRPPWYRSWWAYLLFGLALVTMIWFYRQKHRRQLAEERSVNARLREVDKLKDEFLANTSHELRTPLYGMTGLAESLIDGAAGELPPKAKKDLAMVVSSGRRLSRLVDDILDFSKLRHHQLELQRESVDVHALVEVVLALSAPLVGAKPVRLENAVRDLPPAWADTHRLQQVFYNLIGNAIKFTHSGAVVVSGEVEKERLVVHVQDTGVGIPEAQQARIFDPFQQADASVERIHGGTGLGLAVTRSLVELHGGTMDLQSTPGEGSTFSFDLPLASPGEGATAQEPASSLGTLGVGSAVPTQAEDLGILQIEGPRREGVPRILAVDDEPINLQILHNYLAFENYDLVTVTGGEEALRRLADESFDLVLLDIMMPKLSGFEVCNTLRRMHSREKLPVIFLTAKDQDQDVVAGLAAGANDYLRKPIAKDELLARLRPHLEMVAIHHKLEDLVQEKLEQIKVLEGILPICFQCKMIRDEDQQWTQMELYIDQHSEAQFSHGLCPGCAEEFLKELQ